MPDVLQCPYCDLRFTSRSELEQHKAFDHPHADDEEVAAPPVGSEDRPAEPADEPAAAPKRRGLLSRLFKQQ